MADVKAGGAAAFDPFDPAPDPFGLFEAWFAEAVVSEPSDPNAMTLATVGPGGQPSARTVLLKGTERGGFVFYTNLQSRKGEELGENPKASLCFYWKSLRRQVRAEGGVTRVSDAEADAYFASRPRGSRIGAWASEQSRPLGSRDELLARVARFERAYPGGAVARPPHWSGFRLEPLRIEFWRSGEFRLHDRLVYSRPYSEAGWRTEVLYP